MRPGLTRAILALGALAWHLPALAQTSPRGEPGEAFALVRALDEAGKKGIWPGFDPSSWPLALYDGEKTYLLRHPRPPAEFSPLADRAGAWAMAGRFPAVTGNSTREIGGARTATVIATPESDPKGALLAIVEEVFHVFWLARRDGFRPDEMARYGYPLEDAANWTGLLAEDEALARSLDAKTEAEAAGWAEAALEIRRGRATKLAPEVREYETALEMLEGTANYVARRAADEGPAQTAARLREARPAEGIRWRFYDTGAALCWILDRLAPDWKARSEASPDRTTAEFLEGALKARNVQPAKYSRQETTGLESRAAAGAGRLAGRRASLRRELMERAGPRVVIEIPEDGEPLRLVRFDPVNLFVLGGGEVAHPHFIALRSSSGSVEWTNAGFTRGSHAGTVALTASAGRRPLGDGIRRLTIVGVRGAPQIARDGGIVVTAPGLRIEWTGADLRIDGETVRVVLPKGTGEP